MLSKPLPAPISWKKYPRKAETLNSRTPPRKPGERCMAQLEVRELGSGEFQTWDVLVANSAQGTIFHTSDWLTKNASLTEQALVLLGCYEGEALIGGCPLYLSRPYNLLRLASSKAVSTPYGGMVISRIEHAKQRAKEIHANRIIIAILEYIAHQKFDYVNLVNSPGLQDIRAFAWQGWSPDVYYTYILPLDGDILKRTSKDVRQKVRKAQRLGIDSITKFDPDTFWDLTVRTFAKQGKIPPISRRHLVGLLHMIYEKGIGAMRIANTPSGEAIAADVTVWDTKMAHSWAAATSPDHLTTGAAPLLCYDLFNSLKDGNHERINMMSGNTPQLSTFVAGFNPRLVPYYGVDYPRFKYRIIKKLKDAVYSDGSIE